jgi:hypothetical protein
MEMGKPTFAFLHRVTTRVRTGMFFHPSQGPSVRMGVELNSSLPRMRHSNSHIGVDAGTRSGNPLLLVSVVFQDIKSIVHSTGRIRNYDSCLESLDPWFVGVIEERQIRPARDRVQNLGHRDHHLTQRPMGFAHEFELIQSDHLYEYPSIT